jgi:type IV secretion system protein VirD4
VPTDDRVGPSFAGGEYALIAVGGGVVGIGVVTWLGAKLAALFSGGAVRGGLGEWLVVAVRLARGHSPADAWGEQASALPNAVVYWLCTGVVLAAAAGLVVGGVVVWRRVVPRTDRRVRFGQDTDAREARPRDVGPLIVDSVVPPTGRMLLGRMSGGGPLLATEDRERHPLEGRDARRQGNRGSVALVGPTGSGKTALATSAIATWDGPVVAVSVKRDLYDTTVAARAHKGSIAVFDPGGATGLPTARWSPLESTITSSGALRTGRALAQAIPRGGVTNADYWAEHGEALLGAFMCIAGLSRLLTRSDGSPLKHVGMEQLAAWVRTIAGATEPTINSLLRRGLDKRRSIEVQLLARHAAVTFIGIGKEDHKIRSSVYSTAVLALKPWLEPSVAHSATNSARHRYASKDAYDHVPRFVDLEWLLGGGEERANTLYLAAPSAEFERLSPVLGGLLADIKDTIHTWDIAGRPLEKPLLIVIDEAAQLQLGWLPTEVSTIAALGAFFVTCWQNLAQINHRYGTLADAVLSGHRTKCFFAGVDDPATTRYLTGLLGHEQVARFSKSHDVPSMWSSNSHGRRSVSQSTQREEFAPVHAIRQMYPGQAVLLHGTLPPVHLDAIRWWAEDGFRDVIPRDQSGTIARQVVATCPLTDVVAPEDDEDEILDSATVRDAKAQLPAPQPKKPADAPASESDDSEAPDAEDETAPEDNADGADNASTDDDSTMRCSWCKVLLQPGEGRWTDDEYHCAPNCSGRHRVT